MTRHPTLRRLRHEAAAAVLYQATHLPRIGGLAAWTSQVIVVQVAERARLGCDAATYQRAIDGLGRLQIALHGVGVGVGPC